MSESHAVSTPNKKPPTQLDAVKIQLAGSEMQKQLRNLLGNEEEVRRFQTMCIEYVRRVPKLLQTDKQSLVMALVTAAQFRFSPSNVAGEAYIIPYGAEAKFQLGYQGYVTLFYRAGVKDIKSVIVFKNDQFRYEEGLSTVLEHIPTSFGEERGDPVGVYCVATTPTGGKVFKVMSKSDIMRIKGMSKAGKKPESPWNSGDPELWMWRKTCLIQLAKLLPKTPDLQKAMEIDYEGEGIEKPVFDIEGPAVGRALHTPDTGEPCPKGLHRGRMSDGDCMGCLEDDLAESEKGDEKPQKDIEL